MLGGVGAAGSNAGGYPIRTKEHHPPIFQKVAESTGKLITHYIVKSSCAAKSRSTMDSKKRGWHQRMIIAIRQQTLISILLSHPQFESEFKLPEALEDRQQINEFIIGRAGYWPDVARRNKEFDRPTWHYQLGATKVIGQVHPPEDPI